MTIRHRLDALLTLFLGVESLMVLVNAGLVLRLLANNGSLVARIVPTLLLAVPIVIAARTVRSLPAAVRVRLRAVLHERRVLTATAFEALAVGASLTAAVAPTGTRATAVGIAAGAAFWAAAVIGLHGRHAAGKVSGTRVRLLSDAMLRIATGACWALAISCIALAERRAAGAIAAALFAAAGFGIGRYRKRRT